MKSIFQLRPYRMTRYSYQSCKFTACKFRLLVLHVQSHHCAELHQHQDSYSRKEKNNWHCLVAFWFAYIQQNSYLLLGIISEFKPLFQLSLLHWYSLLTSRHPEGQAQCNAVQENEQTTGSSVKPIFHLKAIKDFREVHPYYWDEKLDHQLIWMMWLDTVSSSHSKSAFSYEKRILRDLQINSKSFGVYNNTVSTWTKFIMQKKKVQVYHSKTKWYILCSGFLNIPE